MPNWYTVRCSVQRERKSEARLRECSYETYLPRCKRERTAQKPDTVALFPGYFFLRTEMPSLTARERGWGIFQLLNIPVPDEAIEELRSRESGGIIRLPEPFQVGCGVQVAEYGSAFFGQHGLYQGMTPDDRVAVLFTLLGKPVVRDFKRADVGAMAHT